MGLGYTGSYDRVSAFARHWRQEQLEAKLQAAKQSYVPLQFVAGEAFQFDWSEDWVKINGVSTKLQIAHFKLCYSRAYFMRAYLAQSHEMLFEFRIPGTVYSIPLWVQAESVREDSGEYDHGQHVSLRS